MYYPISDEEIRLKEVKKLTVVTQMAMEYEIKPGRVQGPGPPLLAPLTSLVQRLPKAALHVGVNKGALATQHLLTSLHTAQGL